MFLNSSYPQLAMLCLMPFISGAIGWFTNFIAVKMLMRPLFPVNILGVRVQGLLPRRHNELAGRISSTIVKDFLTEENLLSIIKQADARQMLQTYITRKWDEKIDDILSSMPMIQMFLPPEKLADIRDKIVEAFSGNADEFVKLLAQSLEGGVEIENKIRENILAFDMYKLESIIEEIAHREFRYIERLGGFIGFIIGIIQVGLVLVLYR
jgi:uncharacterized membrane protein YheB (UPF0754 family)